MLTQAQFNILYCLKGNARPSQRAISQQAKISLGAVNATLRELRDLDYVDEGNGITEAGLAALEPYKVDNAIIMAAGLSSRFAPISYEKPKGVLTVRGEVLIERQIRQLQEAGINDITVVVGYKKEEFFYLEELMGVKIVINSEYATRNNNSTIYRVQKSLGNTYICSSDDYFTENPFESHVYCAYYAATFDEGKTPEYCLKTKGRDKTIVGVEIGGEDSWIMMGHTYWDKAFSAKFCEILNQEYDKTNTAGKLWEDIYIDHIKELRMVMRCYEDGIIWEFDSLDELRQFDPEFLDNVDSEIMDNICVVLSCKRADIHNIVPIKQGLTNLSFRFEVAGTCYVYRHPGAGTDEIIVRESEAFSQGVAKDLGLDDTFIFEDPEKGWKISRFISNCIPFDYHNKEHVAKAMEMARTLHSCNVTSQWNFDVFEKTIELIDMLSAREKLTFKDFESLRSDIFTLHEALEAEGTPLCLCHNDFYDPNFLVSDTDFCLIDWEYSGMSDYASDLGTFVCCSDYTFEETMEVLEEYFQRTPTKEETFHCIAYIALSGFYWFVWALYKEKCGDPVGEWLFMWYKAAKLFSQKALELK